MPTFTSDGVDLFAPNYQGVSIADRIEVGDCWEWTRALTKGYGYVWSDGKLHYVHRIVWEALVGPIPEGLEIDHLCRNPKCCNPDHLEPVTHAENMRRGVHKNQNSNKTHCPQGHPYSGTNLYVTRRGFRQCRTCKSNR